MKPKTVVLHWERQNPRCHVYTTHLDGEFNEIWIPKTSFDKPTQPPQTLVMEVRER